MKKRNRGRPGTGRTMIFHGAFDSFADAEKRAKEVGGFVRRKRFKKMGVRYMVLKGRRRR